MRGLVVAIDGPAGAGKSTVAKELARMLDYLYLDTGAMYRTLALKTIRTGAPLCEESLQELLPGVSIRFQGTADSFRCFLDGEDVSQEIRSPRVSEVASMISCFSAVRQEMVRRQRELGENGGVVAEGRDIGTVVFPNADLKVYLDASPFVRAQRRLRDLEKQGETTTIEKTLEELLARDQRDQKRQNSPLIRAADAMDLDTTRVSSELVVAYLHSVVLLRIHWRKKLRRG